MTADAWKKLEEAFQRALSLEGSAREAVVDDFGRNEPDLVQQLRDLLRADSASDTDFRQPIEAAVESLSNDIVDPWVGRDVGPWTILERLAGGGMGAVFLAERSDKHYKQVVAVKVMAAQLLGRDAISRFKAERQILANLNHPFIAKLIDGGSTDDGLPYLVMEYIEGLPIDEHCDTRKLGIDQRLALLRNVCTAVNYAHRNLVVHRDLKPSNILVDGEGNPKLLDFGIAKLLEAGRFGQTIAMTREGARAMTPEYASPEQVRGEPISIATDVYALGVLLYRLMTGQSPYGPTLPSSREYEKAIVDTDPLKPSTVVTSRDTRSEIGEQRNTSAERLRRRLQGDLDNIALMALQKDPERRYATASDLSDDIERYLHDEPVRARGDNWLYKSRKFVVRNAKGLSVAAIVLIGVVGLTSFYTLQLADERNRANQAAAESDQVATFLTGLFASASPHEAKGESITAIDLLERGAEQIDSLSDQPQLQAELSRIMASSYTALGETERSIPMLRQAVAAMELAQPRDEISIAYSLHDLAEAYRQSGQLDLAEENLRRALELRINNMGPEHGLIGYTMARLGVVLQDDRRPDEALALQRRGLEIMIAFGDGEIEPAIDIRGNMGNALSSLGRYDEAEALLRETVALSEKAEGVMAPNSIIRNSNLGLVLIRLDEFQEAINIYEIGIERGQIVWPENYSQVGYMTGSMAAALKAMGRMDESLLAYQEAAEITRLRIGEDNLIYVDRLRGLGSILMGMGRYDEAEVMFRRGLLLAVDLQGDDGYKATLLRVRLGQLDLDRGRPEEAEVWLQQVLRNDEKLNATSKLIVRKELGDAISMQRRYEEAEPLLLEALAGKEATTGSSQTTLLSFLAAVTAHYRRADDLDESRRYGERIRKIVDQSETMTWTSALALVEHAKTLREVESGDAEQNFTEAREVLMEVLGAQDPRVLELDSTLK